ncbi:hypothetical protein E5P21_16820 [Escherichia coli]|nr:hypothetical protein E5P21_16820 [Escherichia coli]
MLLLIWWLTAAGVWATAGCAWIFQHLHWVTSQKSPGAFVFALAALIIGGLWLNNALKRLNVSGACLVYLLPRFYVSTSKSIIKALINMHSFEIQLSPIG